MNEKTATSPGTHWHKRCAWWLKCVFLGVALLVVLWCVVYPLAGGSISLYLEKRKLASARADLGPEQLRAWALSQIPTQPLTNDFEVTVAFGSAPQVLNSFIPNPRRCSINVIQGDAASQHVKISWPGDSGYWRLRIGSTHFQPTLNSQELQIDNWAPGICLSYERRMH